MYTISSVGGASPIGGLHVAAEPWVAGGVTFLFACIARAVRGVTRSGALAGAIVCFVLYMGAGPRAFAALVSVFLLAWLTTRWGYDRKRTMGTAERREGRGASQVLANLGVAGMAAAMLAVTRNSSWLLAVGAALAEAAADTVSSEVGQASSTTARLITTGHRVAAGTDGGVTTTGTLGGLSAAAVVCTICALSGLLSARAALICTVAALCGMLIDSYLGALLERKGLLNNDLVNLTSTAAAAGIAMLAAR